MILSYLRTIFLYLVLIACVRLMGKRQIGEMEPAEFVVTMLLANLAAIPMQDGAIPLYSGLVPILTMLGMELVLSGLTLKSVTLRRLLCGKPEILIDNGKIDQAALSRCRVTLAELLAQLRQKDVLDISAVQFAILETNGQLSVFPYPDRRPASAQDAGIEAPAQRLPLTIVEDGWVSRENLGRAGKDRVWLEGVLADRSLSLKDTLLLTLEPGGKLTVLAREAQ